MYATRTWIIPLLVLVLAAERAQAQSAEVREAYFRAVAGYFDVQAEEITILGEWQLPADEIPVVLFVAARAGVSPEAVVALRSSGRSWTELTRRYQIGPSQLHVPFAQAPSSGPLASAYEQYGTHPVTQWNQITLSDEEIVTLVNVRVLSTVLGVRPERVLEGRQTTSGFAELYARLIR